MRLATWNVNSIMARLPRVVEWLGMTRPDVLCLQETKVSDEQFPREDLERLGYDVACHGLSGGRNGVAIVSRIGLRDVQRGFENEPGFPEPHARAISATCEGTRVWSVYIPNGQALDSPAFPYKMEWLVGLHSVVKDRDASTPLAICGDFNVAPTDNDVWDPAEFVGSTHVTPEERSALSAIVDQDMVDVQPRIVKGQPYTYWDYRAGNFHKGFGMRIDLVLLSKDLAGKVSDAYIDRDARKGKLPSDHAPVVVDIG